MDTFVLRDCTVFHYKSAAQNKKVRKQKRNCIEIDKGKIRRGSPQ